jgi:hypothetical protein
MLILQKFCNRGNVNIFYVCTGVIEIRVHVYSFYVFSRISVCMFNVCLHVYTILLYSLCNIHTYMLSYIYVCIYIYAYIYTFAGAIYVEDATMRASDGISFINNSAVSVGGALIGSPRSVINITSISVVFERNTAAKVLYIYIYIFIYIYIHFHIHSCMCFYVA